MKHSSLNKLAMVGILYSCAWGSIVGQDSLDDAQQSPAAKTSDAATPAAPENPANPTIAPVDKPTPGAASATPTVPTQPLAPLPGGGGGGMSGSGGGGGILFPPGLRVPPPPSTISYSPYDGESRQGSMIVMTKDTPSSDKMSAMTEDLSIMFRLLEKTVQSKLGEEGGAEAMNIRLLSLRGQNNVRNMYLQDYGALFFLNANMPLVHPVESKGDAKSKDDNAWEQARRELNASRNPSDVLQPRYGSARQEYNEAKVTALKTALIGNLKYASNMKWIKPNEFIVIVITGSAPDAGATLLADTIPDGPGKGMSAEMRKRYGLDQRIESEITKTDGTPNGSSESGKEMVRLDNGSRMSAAMAQRYGLMPTRTKRDPDDASMLKDRAASAAKTQTMLVVRAAKTDVDAFAAGKLAFDGFKAVVTVEAY
jgi:hypothetical protein